jgi:hypothetical protein
MALDIPASDKLWCLLHEEVIPAPQLHLLACEYAERSLLREREAGREPDPRSWAAIDTKRRWVRKEATDSELLAARAAARAAGAAAWEAARAAEIAWQLDRAFEAANAAEKWGVMTLEALNKAMLRSADFIAAVEQYRVRLAENDYAHFGCKESAAVRRASMDLTRALAELRRS